MQSFWIDCKKNSDTTILLIGALDDFCCAPPGVWAAADLQDSGIQQAWEQLLGNPPKSGCKLPATTLSYTVAPLQSFCSQGQQFLILITLHCPHNKRNKKQKKPNLSRFLHSSVKKRTIWDQILPFIVLIAWALALTQNQFFTSALTCCQLNAKQV